MTTFRIFKGLLPVLLASAFCGAQAADRNYLSKEQVQAMLIGKNYSFNRLSDGNRISWDIRANGFLFGNNRTRNSSDTAKWELKDDGALCIQWRGNSQSGCTYYFKDADKLLRTESRDSAAPVVAESFSIE